MVETGSKLVRENPAGFLRMSIDDDYGDPSNFISKEERQRREKTAEGNKKYRKWLDKVAEYKRTIEMPPEKLVYGELWLWESRYKKSTTGANPGRKSDQATRVDYATA